MVLCECCVQAKIASISYSAENGYVGGHKQWRDMFDLMTWYREKETKLHAKVLHQQEHIAVLSRYMESELREKENRARYISQLENERNMCISTNNVLRKKLYMKNKYQSVKKCEHTVGSQRETSRIHQNTQTTPSDQEGNNKLKKKLFTLNVENKNLKGNIGDLNAQTIQLQEQLVEARNRTETEISKLTEEKENISKQCTVLQKQLTEQQVLLQNCLKHSDEMTQELEEVKQDSLKTKADFGRKREIENCNLKATIKELDETKSRLSKLMGQKLTDNNPNIADLSDKNRPTKLAEMYTELYDNQWTDAFEALDKDNEEETIKTLLSILHDAMRVCKQEATKQMQQLQRVLTMANSEQRHVPDVIHKQLKDSRKVFAELSGQHMSEKYIRVLKGAGSDMARAALNVKGFTKHCVTLCWLMSVQDPPVVLGPDLAQGEHFNTDTYRAYTESGPHVDFVVWPALYLHQDGAVLCKGVAQGFGRKCKQ